MPPGLVEHAREFLRSGAAPATPKGAATVVLLRDHEPGPAVAGGPPQIYLLRRHLAMAFAAGMYAFPGGTVDPRDSDREVAWAGPTPAQWGERLSCDESTARALVCAAVRETFEESGVLLAGAGVDTVVDDTTGDEWEHERAGLVDRSLGFADFLDRRGLVLRTDLLAAWAHWITPEFEPRRYDTRFFIAAMPSGQRTRDVSGEADKVAWMTATDALLGVDSGVMGMLPPTYITIKEMAAFPSVGAAWEAAGERHITTVLPGIEFVGDGGRLTFVPGAVP